MKKLLTIISTLVLGITVLTGCTNDINSESKNLSFTYGNIYNHIKDENGNEMASGLWNYCYLDQRIFKAADVYIPKYFISGDKINFNVKGEYFIEETYPSNLKLDKDAVVFDVGFDFADVIKIKATDIEKSISGNKETYSYNSMRIHDTNIITSRDGNFIPFEDNTYEDLYISINQENGDCDMILNVPYGLYSFDPREINNREIKINTVAFHRNIVYNEERMLSAKQYSNEYISFCAFYLNNKNIKSSDFEFIYNKDEFYIEDIYFDDIRYIDFMAVPLKVGNFKINVNAFGYSWILNVKVTENDIKYDHDIDLNKYSELKNYLDGIKYHEFINPYPGLKGNRYYKEFDEYNTDYIDYLMDDCYYPSYFPSAPKSPIMIKNIEIVGDKHIELNQGCEKSSIFFMNIELHQVDPGCTNPMDRVEYATYNMIKLDDVFKFKTLMNNKDLVLLKYKQVEPIIYETNGLIFYLLRKGDFISAFFKDAKYLYSFSITYDMDKN